MSLACLAYQPADAVGVLHGQVQALMSDPAPLPESVIEVGKVSTLTVGGLATLLQEGGLRSLLPPLPKPPADASPGDCLNLLRCCLSAIDPCGGSLTPAGTSEPATNPNALDTEIAVWSSAVDRFNALDARIAIDDAIRDKSGIVRAAGVAAIGRSTRDDAVDILSIALADDAPIHAANRNGIIATVGDLAARLLMDPTFLPSKRSSSNMLADDARRGLIVRTLADNGSSSRGAVARAAFANDLRAEQISGANSIDAVLTFVVKRDVQSIKAVGRGAFVRSVSDETKSAVRTFLIACVSDAKLEANARFAAGSALTRDDSESSGIALTSVASDLNALSPDLTLGSRFVLEWKFHSAWQLQMHEINAFAEPSAEPTTRPASLPVGVSFTILTDRHPMQLPGWRERLDRTLNRGDTASIDFLAGSLDRIAGKLNVYTGQWDTWGDASCQLQSVIACGGKRLSDAVGASRIQRWQNQCKAAEKLAR